MKVTIDLENLQNIIESVLNKNIETVVKEKVSDLISEQIKNTAKEQIEEICNKRMSDFVEEYIKTTKITVGGGFYSDDEIKEYTVEQYIKNQLAEIMKNQSFKTYGKDDWGRSRKEKEITFEDFVKETFDVNSIVKREIERFISETKRKISDNIKSVFDNATKNMLSENVFNILMASESYQKINDSIKRLTGD